MAGVGDRWNTSTTQRERERQRSKERERESKKKIRVGYWHRVVICYQLRAKRATMLDLAAGVSSFPLARLSAIRPTRCERLGIEWCVAIVSSLLSWPRRPSVYLYSSLLFSSFFFILYSLLVSYSLRLFSRLFVCVCVCFLISPSSAPLRDTSPSKARLQRLFCRHTPKVLIASFFFFFLFLFPLFIRCLSSSLSRRHFPSGGFLLLIFFSLSVSLSLGVYICVCV